MRTWLVIIPLCLLGILLVSCGNDRPFNDTSKTYIGGSAADCARIRFTCPPGQQAFFEGETCGCQAK